MLQFQQRCSMLPMAAFVLAIAGAMSGAPAFGQGGGGLFGGLFRGRPAANGNLGYYPYYGTSVNHGYNIYGN
jgi:hypothetical protein